MNRSEYERTAPRNRVLRASSLAAAGVALSGFAGAGYVAVALAHTGSAASTGTSSNQTRSGTGSGSYVYGDDGERDDKGGSVGGSALPGLPGIQLAPPNSTPPQAGSNGS